MYYITILLFMYYYTIFEREEKRSMKHMYPDDYMVG